MDAFRFVAATPKGNVEMTTTDWILQRVANDKLHSCVFCRHLMYWHGAPHGYGVCLQCDCTQQCGRLAA